MYNYYREPWLVERYAGTLEDVFGNPPCVSTPTDTLSVLVASTDPAAVTCPDGELFTRAAGTPDPATDDHPVPVPALARASPASTWSRSPSCCVLSLIAVRAVGGPLRQMRPFADLFFMGVAFLLLETKNVVQFALLFGTTWFVNALVFMGVLVSVLLAVAISKRVVIRRTGWLYGFLLASVAVNWLVPGSALLELPYLPAARRRRRPRLPADLRRQPRVRQPLPRHRRLDGRLRRQPARGDGRRAARVHVAGRRLPQPAAAGRRASTARRSCCAPARWRRRGPSGASVCPDSVGRSWSSSSTTGRRRRRTTSTP